MEATQASPARIALAHPHPLLLVAAASLTVLSLTGVGVLARWLPGPGAPGAEPARVASAAVQPSTAAPISIQQTVTVPQEKAKAVRSAERAPASVRRAVSEPTVASRSTVSPAPTYASSAPLQAICSECGTVAAVREVAEEPKGSGGGAVAGGIVGGLIGNQWGRGATRDIATVLGALGGAYAGNHIEKSVKESKRYDVVVRFEDGSTRTFSSESAPAWQTGDRVILQNGLLTMGGGRSGGNSGAI